eukprot:scaffold109010_cov34-Tisochrysis_lutea.AAC.4
MHRLAFAGMMFPQRQLRRRGMDRGLILRVPAFESRVQLQKSSSSSPDDVLSPWDIPHGSLVFVCLHYDHASHVRTLPHDDSASDARTQVHGPPTVWGVVRYRRVAQHLEWRVATRVDNYACIRPVRSQVLSSSGVHHSAAVVSCGSGWPAKKWSHTRSASSANSDDGTASRMRGEPSRPSAPPPMTLAFPCCVAANQTAVPSEMLASA